MLNKFVFIPSNQFCTAKQEFLASFSQNYLFNLSSHGAHNYIVQSRNYIFVTAREPHHPIAWSVHVARCSGRRDGSFTAFAVARGVGRGWLRYVARGHQETNRECILINWIVSIFPSLSRNLRAHTAHTHSTHITHTHTFCWMDSARQNSGQTNAQSERQAQKFFASAIVCIHIVILLSATIANARI